MSAAAGEPRAFPWREVMGAAFGLLRLSPRAFWAMTPRELDCALGVFSGRAAGAPGRSELAALMKHFPDRQEAAEHG